MKNIFVLLALTLAPTLFAFGDSLPPTTRSELVEKPATYSFIYKVTLMKPATHFADMTVWIPIPSDTPEQKVEHVEIQTSVPHTETSDAHFGNKMLFVRLSEKQTFPVEITATYRVLRTVAGPLTLDELKGKQSWDPKDYLGADQKVPLTGVIEKLGVEQSKGAITEDQKISQMFNYVTNMMTYNKDGTGWGQGDAVWACSNKRGNCTDFHSLLIGMLRSQKIPARFEMGFPIPATNEGTIPGYHCWMHAYSKAKGWIPMDSSEANKAKNTPEFFGRLPSDRIEFSHGRDINLEPRQKGQALNYFIYPYVEVDGKPSQDFKREFSFKRL